MAAPIFATQVKLGSNLRHAQHRIATVMDDIDRQLIRLLAADARTPLKDLAAGVGLSSPGTADRLRRLQQRLPVPQRRWQQMPWHLPQHPLEQPHHPRQLL